MTNEDRLDNLREDTDKVLKCLDDEFLSDPVAFYDLVRSVCKDFIQLDISLSYNNGDLPGAWGSSKLSKSNQPQPGPSQDGVYHISDT